MRYHYWSKIEVGSDGKLFYIADVGHWEDSQFIIDWTSNKFRHKDECEAALNDWLKQNELTAQRY